MKDLESIFGGVLIFVGVICLLALLLGTPLWILWNMVMPDVFGLPYISFWQAVGLQLVAALLFKDFYTSSKTK